MKKNKEQRKSYLHYYPKDFDKKVSPKFKKLVKKILDENDEVLRKLAEL